MKKILFTIMLATAAYFSGFAQEADSTQNQTSDITIEDLTLMLSQLQHDYNFLYCDYTLHELTMELKDLSRSIDISSNALVINVYNGRYDYILYDSYLKKYNSDCELYNSLKLKVEYVKEHIAAKIAKSDFSQREISLLNSTLDVVQEAKDAINSSLNYFDAALNAYRRKR